MRKFILLLALNGMAVYGQPVVTITAIDDTSANGGHSSFRVTWSTNVAPDNQRIDWGPTSNYTRTIYPSGPVTDIVNQQMFVSGLQANIDMDGGRVVHFRACSHNAGGWGCSGDQTVTIPPVPSVHPVPATLPATFAPIPQPDEAGCTVQTVANDLSDLQAKMNVAAANQLTVCQVIVIPAGSVGSVFASIPAAADADQLSSYNTTSNTLTIGTSHNTYSNGDRLRVSGDNGTGLVDGSYSTLPTGLQAGADYCASSVNGSTLQLTAWPSCSGVVSLGTAGSGQFKIMPFPPRSSHWITVRSNGVYPPDGVRTGPQWQAPANTAQWKPTFTAANYVTANPYQYNSLYFRAFAHHWYIGPGIDFTAGASNQTDTTDPSPWPTRIFTTPTNSFIAIKRNWITGAGYPERQHNPMFIDGSYVDFAENYMAGLDSWRPMSTGFTSSISGATASLSSGTYNTGIGNCPAVGASSVRLTNSTTGTAYVTVRPSDCAVVVTLPSGTTATCSNCVTATGTDWPKNGNGQYSHGGLYTCTFSSGSWTSCGAVGFLSVYGVGELQTITSFGPGPLRRANNYEESHGIFYHIDEGGGGLPLVVPSDIVIQRNVWNTPAKYRVGSSANNGLAYYNRQQLECKRCNRVLIKGNEFYGGFKLTNDGPTILLENSGGGCAAPCQTQTGDITVTSNYIHDVSGGIGVAANFPAAHNIASMKRRYSITNNLITNIAGYIQYSQVPPVGAPANGYCFYMSNGGEDVIIDHNTCYSASGVYPQMTQFVGQMVEGFQLTNNAFYVHNDNNRFGFTADWGASGPSVPNCSGLTGTTGLSCVTNGVYGWSNNFILPGYTNSQTMSGDSDAANWVTAWAGNTNTWIATDSTVVARVANARWESPSLGNYQFTQSSPYVSGGASAATDGTDIGVNQPGLQDDLGWVQNVRALSISSTGFTAAFHAPDASTACYVGYGTASNPTTWLKTAADTSPTQERSIAVTGLTSHATYYYQIWCSQTAPTATMSVKLP